MSGFLPPKSPDIIEMQLMKVHIHSARTQKQNQLDQGVIDHVQERSPDSQQVSLTRPGEDTGHADACQNKTDLGHRGAGQRPL